MGDRRNFRRGGGQTQKKTPTMEKRQQKGPHMVKNAPHNEKNVAKRAPYGEKVAKISGVARGGRQNSAKFLKKIYIWRIFLKSGRIK